MPERAIVIQQEPESGVGRDMPAASTESRAAAKSILTNLSWKIVAFSVAWGFQVYYARVLGPESLGAVSLVIGVVTFVQVFAVMGLDTGLTRFVPQFRTSGKLAEGLSKYLRFALRVSAFVGAAGAVLLVLFRNQLSAVVSPAADISAYFLVLGPVLLLSVTAALFGGALRAAERFQAYSFANDFLPRFSMGLTFAVAYLATGSKVPSYLLGLIAAPAIQLLALAYFVHDLVSPGVPTISHRLSREEQKTLVVFGGKTVVYSLLVTGFTQVVRLILGHYGDNAGVGIYAIAESLSMALVFLQASFGTVFTPQIARLYDAGEEGELLEVFGHLRRWALLAGIPYAVTLVLDRHEVLSLYGPAYAQGSAAMSILVSIQALVLVLGLNATLLYMTGRENINVLGQLLCLATTVAVGLMTIPSHGVLGAALASGAGLVVMNTTFAVAVRRSFGQRMPRSVSLRTVTAILLSIGIVRSMVIPLSFGVTVANILAKLVLAYAVFATAVFLLDRREEDMSVLRATWSRLRLPGGAAG
jgi:O-antigen/teichoic acid export membrane protein